MVISRHNVLDTEEKKVLPFRRPSRRRVGERECKGCMLCIEHTCVDGISLGVLNRHILSMSASQLRDNRRAHPEPCAWRPRKVEPHMQCVALIEFDCGD